MANATLAYDFVNNPSLKAVKGPTLSITRATTATVMGSDGYLKRVASGEARFTGAQRRENIALYSNDFTQANWNKLQCSVAAASGVSPPSGYTGSVYLGTPSGTTGQLYQTFGTPTPGASLVFSVWLKSATGSDITMNIGCNGSGNVVNPINETITVTSEWQRFSITTRVTTPTNTINFIIGGAGASWATGEDIHIFGAQVERVPYGTTTPSEYIPTTTAAVSKVNYAETIASHVSRNGLFVEEARTNLFLQSEDVLTSWVASNTNTTAGTVSNQTTAPDGSYTADKILDDAATGTGSVGFYQNRTVSTSTTYTWSAFLKADQLTWGYIEVALMASQSISAYFDLSNGVVGATLGANNTDQGIEDFGNGWYRCWVSFTSDGADTTCSPGIYCADTNGDVTVDRDGTSSIFVWGAQLEAGAFPSSYIPTTTASVTRNAEAVSTTDMSWFNGYGTIYSRSLSNYDDTANKFIYGLGVAGSGTQRWLLFRTGSPNDEIAFYVNANGEAATPTTTSSPLVEGVPLRVVAAFDPSLGATESCIHYTDGTVAPIDTSSPTGAISGSNVLYVGASNANQQYLCGHIAELAYWPERLSNADLAALSNAEQPVFVGAGESVMLDDDFMRRRRMLRRLRR